MYITRPKQFKLREVPMVVSILTHCILFHSVLNLNVIQMNVQCSLIWELMLYEFEMGHNAMEATKNICWVKVEGENDHNTVTRWFKKFCLGCKNLNDQARSDRPKTVNSKP